MLKIMGDTGRLHVRRVYVWRAVLFGSLFGLIIGTFFIAVTLGFLWFLSDTKVITPLGITGSNLMLLGAISVVVIVFLSAVGVLVFAFFYNLLAKFGGGLHVELEEKDFISS